VKGTSGNEDRGVHGAMPKADDLTALAFRWLPTHAPT